MNIEELEKKYKIDIMLVSKDRPTEVAILLQSLRTQTHQNWDLFIMDDRSGAPLQQHHFIQMMINRLKLEGHNVIVWRNDIPYGVTRLRKITMEKIMKIGKGNCVARIDDDNIFNIDYFERLSNVLEAGYDIASGVVPNCGVPFIKRETRFVKPFISDVKLNEKGEIVYFGDDCGIEYLEKEIIPSPNFRSMALIKKEVHKEVEYEDNLGFCSFREEQFFSFRALLKGFKIGVDTGAIAYHLCCNSGGERTKEYSDGLVGNHTLLNNFCKKEFLKNGDFLQKYRNKIIGEQKCELT